MTSGKYTTGEMKGRRDISRKRGIYKYFSCILYYKGDLAKKCQFTNNRCNLFVQFFENPSDSFNSPPDLTTDDKKSWSAANNGWGRLRPIVFSNPRSAVVDVVQNYEYNMINPPAGISTINVPNQGEYPDEDTWEETFRDEYGRSPPYEWENLPNNNLHTRRAYRLRPLSNLVTNSGLHLFRIQGAGGKFFPFYRKGVLHPALKQHETKYVQELQRISFLSYEAHKIRFDMLTETGNPKLPQYPPPIRRFRFPNESRLQRSKPFFPIFTRCTPIKGLLDIHDGLARFRENNFSYPCVAFDPAFENLLAMPQRQNVIQSQVSPTGLTQPLFRSLAARERFRESGERWGKEAARVLQRNQYNPDIYDVIAQLREKRTGYGPLEI